MSYNKLYLECPVTHLLLLVFIITFQITHLSLSSVKDKGHKVKELPCPNLYTLPYPDVINGCPIIFHFQIQAVSTLQSLWGVRRSHHAVQQNVVSLLQINVIYKAFKCAI